MAGDPVTSGIGYGRGVDGMTQKTGLISNGYPSLASGTVGVLQTSHLRGVSPPGVAPRNMTSLNISFQRLDKELSPPVAAHDGDAGFDLRTTVDISLRPGERATVPTGLAVAIPAGFAGLVLPRSGHARRSGVGVVNGPGLIDSGYRGEIQVILINHGEEPVTFRRGDRIAQLMVVPVPDVVWTETARLDATSRGDSGFGSSGT